MVSKFGRLKPPLSLGLVIVFLVICEVYSNYCECVINNFPSYNLRNKSRVKLIIELTLNHVFDKF